MSNCSCGKENKIIYACAGASDIGELSYKVAKKMSKDGCGKMTCLSGLGAHLDGYIDAAKGADETIVIDGCPVGCAKKIFEHLGLKPTSLTLTDFGFVKGQTELNDETINRAYSLIKEKIGGCSEK